MIDRKSEFLIYFFHVIILVRGVYMDFLFEAIFELILEGSFRASKSSKIPKPIRYFLVLLLSLIYVFIIGFILFIGIVGLSKNILAGIVLIAFGLLLVSLCVIEFRKAYLNYNKKGDK